MFRLDQKKAEKQILERSDLYGFDLNSAKAVYKLTTLFVEDAEAGIQAAKAGGFYAAGIGPTADSTRADFRLQKLSDLLKVSV